jgi:outer membrane receptor for ferrienterochelin and colicin
MLTKSTMPFNTIYRSLTTGLLCCLCMAGLHAQYFRGSAVDLDGKPLPYAAARWIDTEIGVLANDSGQFNLPLPPDTTLSNYRIKISFAGAEEVYDIDDLQAEWIFTMAVEVELQEVSVFDQGTGAYISRLMPIKTEIINSNELRKAACCDLAGCFETQATVQPQTTNVLTNAKELRILGLSGVYNRVLIDGLPLIQGLAYTYGMNTLSGSTIDKIWVVKGANSVLHGFEGMVGEITIYPREGRLAEPFAADLLVNAFGEKHLNTAVALKSDQWTNYLAVHASLPGQRFDRDSDTFLDLPVITRYSLYNKWRYRNENEQGWSSFIGLRLNDEQRLGGQVQFDPERHTGGTEVYGQLVKIEQPEIFTKTGYRFNDNQKISLLASAARHDQQSWYGVLEYDATQWYGYANLQYELFYGPGKRHDLKTGVSYRHLDIAENIAFSSDTIPRSFAGRYARIEQIPGVFIENIFAWVQDTLTLITGVRADHLSGFRTFITPRAMLRYLPFAETDIRLSVGAGWRTVNLFAENINLLTSGRDVVFLEALRPEQSVNAGVNITQRFTLGETDFTATADFYHTTFSNQVFPDYDTDSRLALISNFTGTSVSNGFQAEIMAAFNSRLEGRLAYNYLDVYRITGATKSLLPYNARHRVLGVLSFHSQEPRWQVDVNVHGYGRQRLPATESLSEENRPSDFSAPYATASLQYTQAFRRCDIFAGCENIFDFRQIRPIISWQNPFSTAFDTSFVWGPTRGREFYAGVRFHFGEPEKP